MLDIQFAHSGDVNVAYHVVGGGPIDLVYVQGAWSHHELRGVPGEWRVFAAVD